MDTKSKIVKDGWGSPNFQASYGLKMTPEDIEEGNAILEAMQKAYLQEVVQNADSDLWRDPKNDGAQGLAGSRRFQWPSIKYGIGESLAEQYRFTSTGDDEMDIIIATGLRDMQEEGWEQEDSSTELPSAIRSEQAVEPQLASGPEKKKKGRRRSRTNTK